MRCAWDCCANNRAPRAGSRCIRSWRVRSLQPGLRLAAEALFDSHGRKAREARGLRWRGLYLTAAGGAAGGNGAFTGDLFHRFLPADPSLVRPGRLPPSAHDTGMDAM